MDKYGDSLMHLSVKKSNIFASCPSCPIFGVENFEYFPSIEVTKLLIECVGKINAFNSYGDTPLHSIALPTNFHREIADLLLSNI